MTLRKRVLSLAVVLCLVLPGLAAAEESAQPSGARTVSSTTSRYIPPGHTYVQKWTVEQLPGQVFATKADALAAGFNANLMRMDLHQVTTLIPPASDTAPAQNR